jgi:hypothetical protein
VNGIGAGSSAKEAERKLQLTLLFRLGGTRVFEARRGPGSRLLVGMGPGRVKWLAVADPRAIRSDSALKSTMAAAIG